MKAKYDVRSINPKLQQGKKVWLANPRRRKDISPET